MAQDDSQAQLLSAIKSQNEKYMVAYKKADIDALAALHTDDVTVMAPYRQTIKGKDALKAWLREDLSLGPSELVLSTATVERHGITAYETGQYSLTINPEGADMIKDEGNYVVIWQNQPKGEWLYHVDIFNSSLPIN